MTPPSIDAAPTSLVAMLVIAVVALAGVIAFLWRYYDGRIKGFEEQRIKDDAQHAKERQDWAVERATLQAFRDQLSAEYAKRHADDMRNLYDRALEHENAARREYIANMDSVAAKAAESQDKIGSVMQKMADRLGGRRPGSSY